MYNTTREKILKVANDLIERDGVKHFTLEKVANEAGISKGGLLYHFPNKNILIKALLDYYINEFENRIFNRLQNESLNWLKSFIEAHFEKDNANNMFGLVAAIAENPELLQMIASKRKEWVKKAEESKDPVSSLQIVLVCDGLLLSELFGLDSYTIEMKSKLKEQLLTLADKCL